MKRLDSIKYQLEPNGEYMDGLLIDEGKGNIIDMNGKILDEVFHYIVVYDFNVDLNYYERNKNISLYDIVYKNRIMDL